MSRRALALIAAVVGLGPAPARAEPDACAARLDDWEVAQGDLQAGRGCGSYVAATNGATIAYSFGQLTWREPVALPYRMSVTWRRLGSDTRSLELHLLGAVVLLADDEIALWIDDPSFELDGWRALSGYRTRAAHTVSVVQRADAVEVEVDGVAAGRWALVPEQTRGTVSIAFKGQRGARDRIGFEGFSVVRLGRRGGAAGQSQSPATSSARSK